MHVNSQNNTKKELIEDSIVRLEEPKDFHIVEELTRNAFWNLYFPGCHEHYIVHTLRQHSDFIASLSAVMEVDGTVQGAIFYSRSHILLPDGTQFPTITFGPVCIAPHLQGYGLGRKLISHTISMAREAGHSAIVILGYPHHYIPYGFRSAKAYGISMPDGKYYTSLLVFPLQAGALDGIHGIATFSSAFEVNPADVAAFDATFPQKEKMVLPCQKAFEIACQQLDEAEY